MAYFALIVRNFEASFTDRKGIDKPEKVPL